MSFQQNGLRGVLYQAILARHSVRRYDKAPLDETALAQVREIVPEGKPLIADNRSQVLMRDKVTPKDLAALGPYGRFITPPHLLVPYGVKGKHVLSDLGYRAEQIAVRLAALGIGSCFIGALPHEEAVCRHFGLPGGARVGAALVFGSESSKLGGRAVNALVSMASTGRTRHPVERLFFQNSFDQPALPPSEIAPLIEAGRRAPSGVNAQPWRFLWRDGCLSLFVTRNNRRYGRGVTQSYRLYDGGICMANISLAMEALGMAGEWVMYEEADLGIPAHPPDLQPLARLVFVGV